VLVRKLYPKNVLIQKAVSFSKINVLLRNQSVCGKLSIIDSHKLGLKPCTKNQIKTIISLHKVKRVSFHRIKQWILYYAVEVLNGIC